MKKKKWRLIGILLMTAVLAAFLYNRMGAPLFSKYLFTSVSPDGDYKLDVYSEWRFVAMPGDGGSRLTHVILRNRRGWKIGETNDACASFDYDVYPADKIEWDVVHGEVWFAPARGINLHTGKCEM